MGREYTALARSHTDLFTGDSAPGIFTEQELASLRGIMIACGTGAGYQQHQREGDLPCGECAEAFEQDRFGPPRERSGCGSNEGWLVHRRSLEMACDRCEEARTDHVDGKCGTYAGWMLHRRMKTAVCGRCRMARNTYQNSRPRKSRSRT
jgi:hypothetical protein